MLFRRFQTRSLDEPVINGSGFVVGWPLVFAALDVRQRVTLVFRKIQHGNGACKTLFGISRREWRLSWLRMGAEMADRLCHEPGDAKPEGTDDHRSSSAKIISTNGGEEIKEPHACADRGRGHRAGGAWESDCGHRRAGTADAAGVGEGVAG